MVPAIFGAMHPSLNLILSNGIVVGSISAVLLNAILVTGKRSPSATMVAAPDPVSARGPTSAH
jgi:xanthine/uracil permease